jgi:CheY-like chemotaxis protein
MSDDIPFLFLLSKNKSGSVAESLYWSTNPIMMKILVCEDDVVVNKIIQVALEGPKIQLTHAKDGIQAMKLLKQDTYDLIITDIHMPYHNGDEVLNFVRNEQKKNTPIVMISSDAEEEVIQMALKSGVNEFIKKPLDTDALRKKLSKYIR